MNEEHLKIIREEVVNAVTNTVNGKIDKVHAILERQNEIMDVTIKKIDGHIVTHETDMNDLRPWMAGVKGLNILWKFFVAIGIGWYAIKTGFFK